jgi:hypothetical protein
VGNDHKVYCFPIAESWGITGDKQTQENIGGIDIMIFSIFYSSVNYSYVAEVFKFFYKD